MAPIDENTHASQAQHTSLQQPPCRRGFRQYVRQALAFTAVAVLGNVALAAEGGWSHEAPVAIETYGHTFERVHASADGCSVAVRLHLQAPEKAYASKFPDDNHYAFVARVKFSGGKTLMSPTLTNSAAGRRVLSFRSKTDAKGCWAGEPHKLRKVDVHACKGKGCTPRPF